MIKRLLQFSKNNLPPGLCYFSGRINYSSLERDARRNLRRIATINFSAKYRLDPIETKTNET